MTKKRAKRGFTDRLYFLNLIFAWVYTLLCLIFTICGGAIGIEDYSFVSVVCPLVWVELGVHTGFIINKAKMENIKKNIPQETVSWNGNIDI